MEKGMDAFDSGSFSSFASFSGDEFNSSENTEPAMVNKIKDESFADWDADFQSFEDNKFDTTSTTSNKDKKTLTEEVHDVLENCFEFKTKKENDNDKAYETIQDSYKSSLLSSLLQSQILDPIKSKNTITHQFKLNQIMSLLNSDKVKENWLVDVSRVKLGTLRNNFDFDPLNKNKNNLSMMKSSEPDGKSLVTGNIKRTINTNVSSTTVPQIDKNINHRNYVNGSNSHVDINEKYGLTNTRLPELELAMRKSYEELDTKPIEELRTLASELEVQAKIYSELLLSELDFRDDLQRQQEIQNNFISCHVAMERKISQINSKKKGRYGFFKEDNKAIDLTIPYFCQDGGPTMTELSLMTKILTSIERDDPDTPKLISEYVFKLGNRFDLDTVIQVRTHTGVVTPIGSPSRPR